MKKFNLYIIIGIEILIFIFSIMVGRNSFGGINNKILLKCTFTIITICVLVNIIFVIIDQLKVNELPEEEKRVARRTNAYDMLNYSLISKLGSLPSRFLIMIQLLLCLGAVFFLTLFMFYAPKELSKTIDSIFGRISYFVFLEWGLIILMNYIYPSIAIIGLMINKEIKIGQGIIAIIISGIPLVGLLLIIQLKSEMRKGFIRKMNKILLISNIPCIIVISEILFGLITMQIENFM